MPPRMKDLILALVSATLAAIAALLVTMPLTDLSDRIPVGLGILLFIGLLYSWTHP